MVKTPNRATAIYHENQLNVGIYICQSHGPWFRIYFYFHPFLGKISNLTSIFHMGWFNQQPENRQIFADAARKSRGLHG